MRKIVLWVGIGLVLATVSGYRSPLNPITPVYSIRYEVKSEPMVNGQAYLTSLDKVMYMEGGALPSTTANPNLPWQTTVSLAKYDLAQLTAVYLDPENAVSDNTKITVTIYKDKAIFQTRTFVGKAITDAASMIVEGTLE